MKDACGPGSPLLSDCCTPAVLRACVPPLISLQRSRIRACTPALRCTRASSASKDYPILVRWSRPARPHPLAHIPLPLSLRHAIAPVLRRIPLGLVPQLPHEMRREPLPPGLLRRLARPQRLVGAAPVLLLVHEAVDLAHEAVESWPAEDLLSVRAVPRTGDRGGEGVRLGLCGPRTGRPARGAHGVAWSRGRAGSLGVVSLGCWSGFFGRGYYQRIVAACGCYRSRLDSNVASLVSS